MSGSGGTESSACRNSPSSVSRPHRSQKYRTATCSSDFGRLAPSAVDGVALPEARYYAASASAAAAESATRGVSRLRNRMRVATAFRYALLTAALALLISLVAPAAAPAGSPAPTPQRLWQKFPLNGQGTTPNRPQPAAVARARHKTSSKPLRQTPRQVANPQAATQRSAAPAIALVLLVALAAGLLFAEVQWAPLRKGWRRLLEPLRGDARRRPRSRGTPALAMAGAPPLERVDTRSAPVVRSASRLNPFRRGKTRSAGAAAPESKSASPPEEPTHPAVVDRLAQYSLAAPQAPAPRVLDMPPPPPEAAEELPDEPPPPQPARELPDAPPPAPSTLATLHVRIGDQLERAAKRHLALSVVAARLHPSADLAPDLSGVDAAVVTAARQVLGEDAEIAVVDSHDDTIWLILPGVLPKRSRAVAGRLRTTLAADGHAPAIAVAGYPADGKTSDALVERCLDEIARSPASEEDVPTRATLGGRSEGPASD